MSSRASWSTALAVAWVDQSGHRSGSTVISAINAMNPAAVSAPLPADFLVERLRAARVMAVVTLEQVTDVVPLVAALRAGGVRAVEVALRTPSALEALRLMPARSRRIFCLARARC